MKSLIKVCGMREPENIRAVAGLGIDLMGFIFWDKSPRNACEAPVEVPEGVKGVGVFVDETPAIITERVRRHGLNYVQLHGNESPEQIEALKDFLPDVRIIKALSIREADDVKRWRLYDGIVDMLLFDTKCKSVGGSGEQFDWTVLSHYDGSLPFLLSGGIGPGDADRVKAFHHPQCVGIDLNSRFETAPGIKDAERLKEFLNQFKQKNID